METLNKRLSLLIEKLDFSSLRQFDKKIGVALGQTNNIVGDKQCLPGSNYLLKIKENFPQVDLNWLISGEGDMFKSEHNTDIESILEDQKVLQSENNNLKMQLNGLLNMVSVASMNQHVNFHPVSNKKTPAKKRGTVTQLPLFARSVANSARLCVL